MPENFPNAPSSPVPVGPANLPPVGEDIYVMPEKFHAQAKTNPNQGLIIAAVVFGLIVVASATFFIYDFWQRSEAAKQTAENTTPSNVTAVIPEPFDQEPAGLPTEENTTTATSTPDNNPGNTTVVALVAASDADTDRLTDIEENLLGTNATKPDTDSDTYMDGDEVLSNYDPTRAGNFRLTESANFKRVATDFFSDNFQVFIPNQWQVTTAPANRQITITTNTGEIIRISVIENTSAISAANWYLNNNPQVVLSQIRVARSGALEGVWSPDGSSAYLTNPERTKIYAFEYNAGATIREFRYPTLMQFLVKNFSLISAPPAGGSNASTTATTTGL